MMGKINKENKEKMIKLGNLKKKNLFDHFVTLSLWENTSEFRLIKYQACFLKHRLFITQHSHQVLVTSSFIEYLCGPRRSSRFYGI